MRSYFLRASVGALLSGIQGLSAQANVPPNPAISGRRGRSGGMSSKCTWTSSSSLEAGW
ncbi:hypothetical protein PF010_g9753 [Phytophthora fragariae]|uniref:RxLR effector protein n=1 Tax=Phytophthora fragariae TaxID=53985 RepID=A0A6G0RPD9_9STRA|nr:hypothetical protein PF010_g9753 [Phytophthora fragariae]KAE9234514.1 hypothetical protein PF004_g9360 [Phytophthora fragariae]KAE9338753.1 hypothetical protein PF008_g11913 [Phytophthora fragariae]